MLKRTLHLAVTTNGQCLMSVFHASGLYCFMFNLKAAMKGDLVNRAVAMETTTTTARLHMRYTLFSSIYSAKFNSINSIE